MARVSASSSNGFGNVTRTILHNYFACMTRTQAPRCWRHIVMKHAPQSQSPSVLQRRTVQVPSLHCAFGPHAAFDVHAGGGFVRLGTGSQRPRTQRSPRSQGTFGQPGTHRYGARTQQPVWSDSQIEPRLQ